MSVDRYVKYISKQQKSMVNAGLAEAVIDTSIRYQIDEGLELTSEDYIDMLHMYIEDLEGHFEAEDLKEISDTLRQNYVKKSKADLNKNWKKAGYHYNKADDAEDASKAAKQYDSGDKAMKNVTKREIGQYTAARKLGTDFKRKTTSTYDNDHLERRGYRRD